MNVALGIMLVIITGLAGGLAVGAGFVAFIVVLDIIPRLAQISYTGDRIAWLEAAVVPSASCTGHWLTSMIGCGMQTHSDRCDRLLSGMFVGMLAAALTEVLNVLPS